MPTRTSELLIKAVKLVYLFLTRETITSDDVAEELGIDRRNAHCWLLAASIALPVYSPNEEDRQKTEYIQYALLPEGKAQSLTNRIKVAMAYFDKRKQYWLNEAKPT